MRKLLEIEFTDERRKSVLTLYTFLVLTLLLFGLIRVVEKSFFEISFFVEFIFIVGILRFYIRAHKNKNYALWGLTLVVALYLMINILHFTFVNYNIFILYIAFLSALFLAINTFVMSSPLYFPRFQWWEYDFRYRGELKADAAVGEVKIEVRVTDLRRDCMSILSFAHIRLGEDLLIEVPFGEKLFTIGGKLKTSREDIPGRPIRYGIKLFINSAQERKNYLELKKIWKLQKKANIRRKFSDYSNRNNIE